jgi:hypothetical protein
MLSLYNDIIARTPGPRLKRSSPFELGLVVIQEGGKERLALREVDTRKKVATNSECEQEKTCSFIQTGTFM